ncbi:Uncharacterised protein [Sphingobacterium spiritivorum]|uniref:Uncharacterized protein n=1 Tax=Sphingobacterium spiritivorum TaxID=258 RepID=A0A380BK10_SPHSI|nr:hypothetical protein [Sphingobacterium spiritivorum]SUJ02495.1 Uncharacterised protein [Sphingobacterium spiritivorum]
MRATGDNQITSKLFRTDIRRNDFIKEFEKVFQIKMDDFLSEYEYDEIDEFPVEMEDSGIMIGFIAETNKTPAQIAYIDLDVHNYPQHTDSLVKQIPLDSDFGKSAYIEQHLVPFTYLRIYYSLYDQNKVDRIIFQFEDLRYELSLNKETVICRVRICFSENESNINMSTYYLFDNA